ncbi:MAG: S41 family peptidase [Brevundimonas sp.]|uniref:S41 family peptidase n=1 Tax=Brevundimonas sp. TaxID=1871086 RepID=UPI00391CC9A0
MTVTSPLALAAVGAIALMTAAMAREPEVQAPARWGEALSEDARAFHDIILENHAGPVDEENPGFLPLLGAGLDLALSRAPQADSYEHWYFALREYAASFDDGHLGLADWAPMGHSWRARWPGFLTGLRSGDEGAEQHEVVFSNGEGLPPVGAVLVSCDGIGALDLAADRVGRTAGRWNLRSRRNALAHWLFVEQGNPYVHQPRACLFDHGGVRQQYRIVWDHLDDETQRAAFAAARAPRHFAPVEMRDIDGGIWISMGSFESDPSSEVGQRLTALVSEVEARTEDVRRAALVVLDLRGNNGGSSLWPSQIARALWGEERVAMLGPRSQGVDWRASRGNLEMIESYRDEVFADQPEARAWASQIAAGMAEALAAGRPLWRQGEREARPDGTPAPSPVRGQVFVLTDSGCASACLDAVDIFTAMGAVVVGQETSADSLYMDTRDIALPSGRAAAFVPMKVFRGRARGNNETVRPAHEWTGDMGDTAALEAWLRGLSGQ